MQLLLCTGGLSASCLQYPQTGSTSCNLTRSLRRLISPQHLQYPQTGRTSCNIRGQCPREGENVLAVPSDGSNLMQPLAVFVGFEDATLAVPSDGSNLMQLFGQ